MAVNFLEQLIAEWYEYQGYYIRRNVKVGPRLRGGYEGELDVVAFHPNLKRLVHLEASSDTSSWEERETKFRRKFETGRKYASTLFPGLDVGDAIEQFAVFAYASTKNVKHVGGGRVVLLSDLLTEILSLLKSRSFMNQAVPEHQSLLRTLQVVSFFRRATLAALAEG